MAIKGEISGQHVWERECLGTLEFRTNGPQGVMPDLIRTPKVIFSRLRKAQPHPGETEQLCALLWITDDLRPSRALPCLGSIFRAAKINYESGLAHLHSLYLRPALRAPLRSSGLTPGWTGTELGAEKKGLTGALSFPRCES